MSYTTRQALEDRRGIHAVAIMADKDQDGTEDPGVVAATIAEIDALIDGALAQRWPGTVGAPTPMLSMIAVDLVIDRLATGLARTEEIIEAGKIAMALLKDIRDGRLNPEDGGGVTAGGTGTQARAWASPPRMTADALGRLL